MTTKKPDHELTSTIHLGVRAVLGTSGLSQLQESLAKLSEEDRAVIGKLSKVDAMFIVHRGPGKGSRYLLAGSGGDVRMGRAPESEIFLDDVTVSRKHATIAVKDQIFVLNDLGSLNGTYVNGEPTVQASLHSGDEIQIGKFHMLFFGGNQ